MSRYTERLWRELVQDHGAELAGISRPARHGRMARPRLLAGTTAGLAGAGTVLALLLGAASSSPAFAVTKSHDGTVHVVIWRIDALHSVNERLAKLGFRARFVQVAPGCAAPPPMAIARVFARRQQVRIGSLSVVSGSVHARFDPRKIPAGKTLVMTAWRQGHEIKAGSGHIIVGATPNCVRAFAAPPGAVVRIGKGDVVHCLVTGALRPADHPPTTTTPSGVPATTTGSVPTTTTDTGTPPPVTSPSPHEVKAGACPPGAQKALDFARRAAAKKH